MYSTVPFCQEEEYLASSCFVHLWSSYQRNTSAVLRVSARLVIQFTCRQTVNLSPNLVLSGLLCN